jgi:signal transduction histidine kinase
MAVSEVVRIRRAQLADDERRRAGELRLQVAQELHDVLAHNISLINVQASVGLHLVDENPTQAQDALRNIKTASSEALHELRTALDLLRGGEAADRAPAPRLADLDALVDGTRATGLQVELLREGDAVALPADVELAAYRIVQEALTNVTRHARANRVTVRVGYQDGVTVEVVDNGVGGAANAGNGIAGMRERAAALGGSVEIGPQPGSGFRVMAHLPLRPS